MKLSGLIERVKNEKAHSFSNEDVTKFVNEIEAEVQEVLGIKMSDRLVYDCDVNGDTELIAQPPYDSLYETYVKAKIDFANEEYESYANNQAQFSDDFDRWKAYVIRSGSIKEDVPRIKNWW